MNRIVISILYSLGVATLASVGCGGRLEVSDLDEPFDGGAARTPEAGLVRREAGGPDTSIRPPPNDPDRPDPYDPDRVCRPGDVSSFTPNWRRPAPFGQGRCSATQVDALLCLFDAAADPTSCNDLFDDAANQDCVECIYTDSNASQRGPVVIDGNFGTLNVAGCIANATGNVTASGCGAKVQASDECTAAACDPTCPLDEYDDTSFELYSRCREEAESQGCAAFANAATSCSDATTQPGGVAAVCVNGSDFLDNLSVIAKLFCLKSFVDGGAATDAPAGG